MSFNTRKMIYSVILVGVLLALFLGFAFHNIQSAKTSIEITDDAAIDPELEQTADAIMDRAAVPYVDDISLRDIGTDILLVDHQREAACLITGQSKYAVDYATLDRDIVNCNQYLTIADHRETLIINCDAILGNPVVRAIANAYHYAYASTETLNPGGVEYFPTADQDETVSFYRYAMIESAGQCYFNDAKLDDFYYYYDQWTYSEGLSEYQEVASYDYYDGFYAYITAKVRADLEPDFDWEEYIDGYRNDFDIYAKDRESSVMGLLWCLLMEKQGYGIIIEQSATGDIYQRLLDGVPLGQVEEEALQTRYHEAFTEYKADILATIQRHSDDENTKTAIVPTLTAETYGATIQMDDNYYIYLDYAARDSDNNLITQDEILAKITPYNIKLYVDTE